MQISSNKMLIIVDGQTYTPINDTFVVYPQSGNDNLTKIIIAVVVCIVLVALIVAFTVVSTTF